MSYNARISALLSCLGITSGRLPVAGMSPRMVYDWAGLRPLLVWVTPLPPMPVRLDGRIFKRSTHRLMCKCPTCGRALSAGRLHQHIGTAVCVMRCLSGPAWTNFHHENKRFPMDRPSGQ